MDQTNYPLPDSLITVSPDYLSGAPVSTGTRVPMKALFDYLEAGDPLDEFLAQFPDVSREYAVAVIKLARAMQPGGAVHRLRASPALRAHDMGGPWTKRSTRCLIL